MIDAIYTVSGKKVPLNFFNKFANYIVRLCEKRLMTMDKFTAEYDGKIKALFHRPIL